MRMIIIYFLRPPFRWTTLGPSEEDLPRSGSRKLTRKTCSEKLLERFAEQTRLGNLLKGTYPHVLSKPI